MNASIVRRKRRRSGKVVPSRHWYIKYRPAGESGYRYLPLKVHDKNVAREKLREFVRDAEREAAGIVAPKPLRDAAQKLMTAHLADFMADLGAKGRDAKYVYNVGKHVTKLIEQCGWNLPKDVTADSFADWRKGQGGKPKTLNQYLADASALLNWMRRGFVRDVGSR